jgi:hypothetical protein
MPSPRDLDPKFTATTPPEDTQPEDTQPEDAKDSRPEDEDVPMIVHKVRFIDDNGVQQEKEFRMPVSEWPAFAAKHGF